MIGEKVLSLVSAELGQSAFSSVATKRNLTDLDVRGLILEMDYDAHSSEDEDISAQSD